ncbi:hypothetical protein PENTCL1PPCAC_5374, partial [Pristionchus entomophagus]
DKTFDDEDWDAAEYDDHEVDEDETEDKLDPSSGDAEWHRRLTRKLSAGSRVVLRPSRATAMPEFLLQLDNEKVEFASEKLGEEQCTTVVKIKNTQKDKYFYKIKCTSNELFRIRPPLGYIKPGEAEDVKLIFNADKPVPESGKHYFVVYYRKADGDKAPRSAWSGKEPEAMKRLYINFSKKKKEEKKEEEKKEEKKEEEK